MKFHSKTTAFLWGNFTFNLKFMTERDKINFRDDCAIAAMGFYIQMYNNSKNPYLLTKNSSPEELISVLSFEIAEAMLREKIKRDDK